jgi:hypothetical protein
MIQIKLTGNLRESQDLAQTSQQQQQRFAACVLRLRYDFNLSTHANGKRGMQRSHTASGMVVIQAAITSQCDVNTV